MRTVWGIIAVVGSCVEVAFPGITLVDPATWLLWGILMVMLSSDDKEATP